MQNIINYFFTPNQFLCGILTFPLTLIEMCLYYYLAKTIYNINVTKKRLLIFLIISTILCSIIRLSIPLPYSFILIFALIIVLEVKLFNLSIFKSIILQCIQSLLIVLFEYIINIFVCKVIFLDIYQANSIPIYKCLFTIFLYFGTFITVYISKFFKINLNLSDEINKADKFRITLTILAILFIVCPNMIFLILIDMEIPTSYIVYNIICAFVFFLIGTYNTYKFNKSYITDRELETANLYNKNLSKLVDSNRGFKHDINNIIQAIGGYIQMKDLDGLENYYETGLLPEIQKVNNLSLLNPDVINNPPLFGLFLAKYDYADTKGVKINLISFFDYSTINTNIFDFVKIFGILFDNAIEAASLCEDKLVEIHVSIDFYNRKQNFTIKNTYANKDINTNKIFEKDFSTKKKKSGFGLWEVKELLKKYDNLELKTNKNDKFFIQKLEVLF